MKYLQALLPFPFCILTFSPPLHADDMNNGDDTITHIEIHPAYGARNEIATDTGSSKYVIDQKSLDNLPQSEFTPLNDVLLQAPGVAQDSYGQVHIRGDHDNLQYRINDIILPEGISGFGQTLDTHIASKVDLLTGALPAQYGYRTAGVVDITTPTGNITSGGRSSIMMGSNNTLEANQEFYGSSGQFNYFLSGSYTENNRGIEPPTNVRNPIHDDTTQDKQFGYLSYAFNPETRLSVIFGNSTNRFEIPDNPNQPQNFNLQNVSDVNSSSLNEHQFEHNTYGIAALQGAINDDTSYQIAYFTRYSDVLFKPDTGGDLIFNGIASRDSRENTTNGLQNDFKYSLNGNHILRAGWSFSYEQANTTTSSLVFPADSSGAQTSSNPVAINYNSSQPARLFGMYLQDEWHLSDKLTVNYGARLDYYDAYVSADQLSPRLGLVYEITADTTLHTGYARYFTPPPTELIASSAIGQFAGTTGLPPSTGNSPVLPERDHYFDAGIIHKMGKHLTLGLDAYYKQANHLLDEGQFGQALIFAPFNYDKGWVRGAEFSMDYSQADFNAYANLAVSKAMGKGVESGQYNFGQDELDYIAANAVHLDHDQLISGSLGANYTFQNFRYGTNMLYGSGLRDGFANTDHLPFYTQINVSAEHAFDFGKYGGIFDSKLSIINLFDRVYEIRDGSGIGVFAPQYGPRRGIFLEISKSF